MRLVNLPWDPLLMKRSYFLNRSWESREATGKREWAGTKEICRELRVVRSASKGSWHAQAKTNKLIKSHPGSHPPLNYQGKPREFHTRKDSRYLGTLPSQGHLRLHAPKPHNSIFWRQRKRLKKDKDRITPIIPEDGLNYDNGLRF